VLDSSLSHEIQELKDMHIFVLHDIVASLLQHLAISQQHHLQQMEPHHQDDYMHQ
jgi:hypothetical protein